MNELPTNQNNSPEIRLTEHLTPDGSGNPKDFSDELFDKYEKGEITRREMIVGLGLAAFLTGCATTSENPKVLTGDDAKARRVLLERVLNHRFDPGTYELKDEDFLIWLESPDHYRWFTTDVYGLKDFHHTKGNKVNTHALSDTIEDSATTYKHEGWAFISGEVAENATRMVQKADDLIGLFPGSGNGNLYEVMRAKIRWTGHHCVGHTLWAIAKEFSNVKDRLDDTADSIWSSLRDELAPHDTSVTVDELQKFYALAQHVEAHRIPDLSSHTSY